MVLLKKTLTCFPLFYESPAACKNGGDIAIKNSGLRYAGHKTGTEVPILIERVW
jgi:hypothetical protein